VKVLRQSAPSETRRIRSFIPKRLRRQYDNNAHEFQVLTALFARLGPVATRCLPQCYGWTETDLGRGLVLDLIRDHDGNTSRSLRQLVSTGTALANFRPAFDELGAFLIQHKVVTRALLNHNIVAQRLADGGWRLFLMDGWGDPSWLPLGRWIPGVAEARIRRKVTVAWARFERFAAKHE
jgi:hypothetical protein